MKNNDFYYIIFKIRFFFQDIFEEIRMYRELRKITPKDCKQQLLEELIFSPRDIRDRYEREINFKNDLEDHWS